MLKSPSHQPTPCTGYPKFGHLKSDHRMDRCFLAGLAGDTINAVLAAAGSKLRKLLRRLAAELIPLRITNGVRGWFGTEFWLFLCALGALLCNLGRTQNIAQGPVCEFEGYRAIPIVWELQEKPAWQVAVFGFSRLRNAWLSDY